MKVDGFSLDYQCFIGLSIALLISRGICILLLYFVLQGVETPKRFKDSSYNLRRQRHFNMPKLCTNRTNSFLYMRCGNSPGRSFIPLIFILCNLTYFHLNTLYGNFNIILIDLFSHLNYNQHANNFFPWSINQWNRLPGNIVNV